MLMGPCPSCGRSVDLEGSGCPFCGASLQGLAEDVQAGARSAQVGVPSGFLAGVMGAAAVVAFVLGVILTFGVSLPAGLAAFGFALAFLGLWAVLRNQRELAKVIRSRSTPGDREP